MGLKLLDLLHGVVVEDPNVHVVARGDEPLLAHDELSRPHGQLADVEALDGLATGVVPEEHVAVVERRQDPRLGRVHVHALHPVRPRLQHLLDLEPERLCVRWFGLGGSWVRVVQQVSGGECGNIRRVAGRRE